MRDQLRRIGSDGSLKIGERWLGALRTLRAGDAATPILELALAGWVNATRPTEAGGQQFGTTDPAAAALADCWRTRPRTRRHWSPPCCARSAPPTWPSNTCLISAIAQRLPAVHAGQIEI